MTAAAASVARVAVVGAGLAGLRAAWRLDHAGLDVVVYEARETVGGRATGEWRSGHWMDSAWPVLDAGHGALLHWIAELGLADELLPLRPVQMHAWHAERAHAIEPTSLRGAAWIPGFSSLQALKLLRWPRLMARHAPLLDARKPDRAAPLDFRSVRDHVELYFGRAALDCWITPELQTAYGDAVEDLSRVALLQFAKMRGLGAPRVGHAGLPRRPLFELATAAADRLRVHRATRVQRIDEEASGGFRVEAIDARGLRSAADYDAVVVATAAPEALRITASGTTTAERDVLAAVRERPVVCLALALEGDAGGVPREIRFPRGDDGIVSAYVVEPGQLLGRAPEGGSQIVALLRDAASRRAEGEPDDVVVKHILRALGRARPGLAEQIREARLARTLAPFFEVGSYRRLARFFAVQRDRRALGRRLYWAGDYLAGAGFEAGVLSGDRAADDLIADLA